MSEKVIEKKRINAITMDGKQGFFVPKEIFHGEDCIIIISSSAGDVGEKSFEKIVTKAENKIFICYSGHTGSEKKSSHQKPASIELNFYENKSRLFKSLNKSLDEVITYRTSNSRPKTMEEFLDEL
jgi:hypothetical protein